MMQPPRQMEAMVPKSSAQSYSLCASAMSWKPWAYAQIYEE
jgi:hypothetical protein